MLPQWHSWLKFWNDRTSITEFLMPLVWVNCAVLKLLERKNVRMMDNTHRIHVWYIYLHECLIFMVNVGKYTTYMDSTGYTPTWACFEFRSKSTWRYKLGLAPMRFWRWEGGMGFIVCPNGFIPSQRIIYSSVQYLHVLWSMYPFNTATAQNWAKHSGARAPIIYGVLLQINTSRMTEGMTSEEISNQKSTPCNSACQ